MTKSETNLKRVKQGLRDTGFKIVLIFALVIASAITISPPQSPLTAWMFVVIWLSVSLTALLKPQLSLVCARVWVVFTTPLAPIIILQNGMIPATAISLAIVIPIILMNGLWRIIPVLIITGATFLVPFSALEYDSALWFRMCITNVSVAVLITYLATYLEKALAESLDKSDALKAALEGEQRARQTQSNFLASMSHEIRTPMNGILGLVDVVMNSDIKEEQRAKLEKVMRSGTILHTILNDILDHSKLTAGKLIIEAVPTDIERVIEDARSLFEAPAQAKGLQLLSYVDERLAPCLLADPTRISQILTNLLSNAIKFTEKGKVELRVDVMTDSAEYQYICFSISDTGIGIEEQQVENIFKAFTQADSSISRGFGGTGLGLQISKDLVNIMGGTIELETRPKQGSRFFFTLSLDKTNNPAMNQTKPTDVQSTLFSGAVLVVDDNEINLLVAQEILQNYGLDVELAQSGEQAIEAVAQRDYALVFMDISMPHMSGLEATARIRKTHQDLPIVALSAAVLESEVDEAMHAGMNGHLAKPIDKTALLEILARFVSPQ